MYLDSFPTEILELIVEPITEGLTEENESARQDAILDLKSLRLVSRVAATLPSVQVALFSKLSVYGIPQHVDKVGRFEDVQRILPYVRSVAFQAYPFPSTVTRDEYMVLAPLDRDQSFEQDFKTFLSFAQVAEGCLHDQRTRKVWQNLLGNLTNLQKISIDTTLDQPLIKNSNIWKHFSKQIPVFRDDLRSNQSYVNILGPKTSLLCQQLARSIVQCVADMQLPLKSLRLAGIFRLSFDWRLVAEIERVDWRNLRALEVSSYFVFPRNHPDQNSACISSLLAQTSPSLQELTVSLPFPPRELYWPPLGIHEQSLERLKRLEIRDMPLNGQHFVLFILAQTQLSHIVFDHVKSNTAWKMIFDGLRDHPNILTITFCNMHMSFFCTRSARSFKTRPGYFPGMFDEDDPRNNLDDHGQPTTQDKLENIILYIQNYIPWTQDLEKDLSIVHGMT